MKKVVRNLKVQAAAQSLWENLKEEAEYRFRFKILRSTPIKRGWLNQKWKIETDEGSYLLKQYNKERFKKYSLHTIQTALQTQNHAYQKGVPSPELLAYKGQLLQESSTGEIFTVMRFVEGHLIQAGEATTDQMESLGRVIGKLHRVLNDGHLTQKTESIVQIPSVEERLQHWEMVIRECEEQGLDELKPVIRLQKEVTERMDSSFIKELTAGWCHRDLWVDNLLFSSESVTGILDFDRLNYDFIEMDIGRVIISTCLQNETLNTRAVHAFIDGYNNTNELSIERLIRSLKVVWYMESKWWISVTLHEGEPPKRFAQEMIWLAKNLENLTDILYWKKEAIELTF